MSHHRFDLAPLPELPGELSHSYDKLSEVAGTYIHDQNRPLIEYNPKSMRNPLAFINTRAHEVMHDRLAEFVDDLPGGETAHELSTDLHCIIMGFGLFQIQAADDLGWSGYMTQPSRAYAPELFLSVNNADRQVTSYMSKRTAKLLSRAAKVPRLRSDVAAILSA